MQWNALTHAWKPKQKNNQNKIKARTRYLVVYRGLQEQGPNSQQKYKKITIFFLR